MEKERAEHRVKNRALIFGAAGLAAGLLIEEYWPVILKAIQRYDTLREMSGQDSLTQNLLQFLSSTLGNKKDGTPASSADELYDVFRERIVEDLVRYAKLKSM
jgi:hypothetical protein